ncbi:MAG: hypothetical protein COT37_02240 [Parcubacteria group bacterium CG08_land_8_20_14_0_20_43_9]|nr:MAG: hypothetical protein COT37_02240 [Parcubacteria group bacterium CG08_land_8_20_14_0_20_43_9]
MRNKILIIIIVAFLIAGAIGYWLYQRNDYSKEILRLDILGPETISAGGEVEYSVRIKNNGDVRLEEPRLIFEFPEASQPLDGEGARVTKESDAFDGFIYPGDEKIFRFRTVILGKQGDLKEAKATVSYRPKNIKAKYVSRTSHLLTINEVPLTFEFDIPSSVGGGQELNFSLNYFSSMAYSLSDLQIKITYPSDFSLKETDPKGLSNTEWNISLLNKAEGGRVDIKGSLSGEVGATKEFKAELGTWKDGNLVILKETTKQVKIVEQSLYITQTINNSPDYIAAPGDLLHYEITFRNIGTSPLQNLFLASKLNGLLFDFTTIKTPDGQSQSGDNSIIWDWHKIPKLQFLDAGEEGLVEFWVELKEEVDGITSAKVENEIILGQTRRKFVNKINANLEFVQEVFADDEIFGSNANFPLEVGKESNFTVIWKIKNYYNPLNGAKVRAVLPAGVNLTGQIAPQKLSFDPETREIIWLVGDLAANQGINEPLQLAFQIKLKPNVSQEEGFVELVKDAVFSGFDEWTEMDLQTEPSLLTTEVFGDNGKVK